MALHLCRPTTIAGLALTEARDGFRAEGAGRSTTAASRNSNACGNEQVQSDRGKELQQALEGVLLPAEQFGDLRDCCITARQPSLQPSQELFPVEC